MICKVSKNFQTKFSSLQILAAVSLLKTVWTVMGKYIRQLLYWNQLEYLNKCDYKRAGQRKKQGLEKGKSIRDIQKVTYHFSSRRRSTDSAKFFCLQMPDNQWVTWLKIVKNQKFSNKSNSMVQYMQTLRSRII